MDNALSAGTLMIIIATPVDTTSSTQAQPVITKKMVTKMKLPLRIRWAAAAKTASTIQEHSLPEAVGGLRMIAVII